MIEFEGQTYLTTDEAKKRLGISRQTVYDYISAGKLHPVTFAGRQNYFPETEVEALKLERSRPKPKNFMATLPMAS